MPSLTRRGLSLRRLIPLCLITLVASPGLAADPLAWRDAPDMKALVAHLETWLDDATDLPRRAEPPAIRLTADAVLVGGTSARHGGRTRGLYDAATATVWLIRPWDARDPRDVSVLLHELVHHRQAGHGHWYCAGAQELPAYRAQKAWLAGLGLEAEVNWIAVVLEAGCTPRDIHPD